MRRTHTRPGRRPSATNRSISLPHSCPPARGWFSAACAAGLLALAGCSGGGSPAEKALAKDDAETELSTGLDVLGKDGKEPPFAGVDSSVPSNAERALDLIAKAQSAKPIEAAPKPKAAPERGPDVAKPIASEPGPDAGVATNTTVSIEPAVPAELDTPSLESLQAQEEAKLVAQLATLLRERAAKDDSPGAALLKLAALELATAPGGQPLPEPDAASLERLSPVERKFLDAWREMFSKARSELGSSADVATLASGAAELARSMQALQPLALPSLALAKRVDGFGLYNEFAKTEGSYRFIAGRPHKAIVYAEVEGFEPAPTTRDGAEGFVVKLTQDVQLFHFSKDADLLAWQRPSQAINDFSRKRRRDFYVTQIIELPSTLTVGSYRLKVTVRDEASGASAQAVVPVDIVADSSALSEAPQ